MAATEDQVKSMMNQFKEAMDEMKKIRDENSALQKQLLTLIKGKTETEGEGSATDRRTPPEDERDRSMMSTSRTFKPKPKRPEIDSEIDDLEWQIFKTHGKGIRGSLN